MKKLAFLSCLVAIAMMTACGNKTKEGQGADSLAADSLNEAAVNQDSMRHTVEYITQRLDSIYKMHSDEKGCSEHYKALVEKAGELSMKTNGVFLDGDHWVNGNDIDPKFYAKLKKVLEMNDSTAKVEMNVHNFHDQKIILDLVYERGDWYVDNFHSFSEEDGDNHEMDEVKFLHEYIRQTSNDIYQDKIEKKYGKNFPINKYLDDLRNQWGNVFGVGDNLDLFNEYAVIDIDQDGQPECWCETPSATTRQSSRWVVAKPSCSPAVTDELPSYSSRKASAPRAAAAQVVTLQTTVSWKTVNPLPCSPSMSPIAWMTI